MTNVINLTKNTAILVKTGCKQIGNIKVGPQVVESICFGAKMVEIAFFSGLVITCAKTKEFALA